MTTRRADSSIAAFSLVETALAIGVIGFAFVSLLTLLPVGLANFRSAIDTTVCAQIFQRVISDAEQADFDRLTGMGLRGLGDFYVLPNRDFDDQGNEVVPRTPGLPSPMEGQQIIYQVHVRGSVPGANGVDVKGPERFTSLPAAGGGRRFSPRDSTFLTVQIAHHPGGAPLPMNALLLWEMPRSREESLALTTFSAVVARNGFPRPAVP